MPRKKLANNQSGTISGYNKDLSKLKKFRSEIGFNELTETFLRNYEIYMKVDLLNNNNTINRTQRFLRNFINRAIKKGLTENYPFKNYKLAKAEATTCVFLTVPEARTLANYCNSLPDNHKHKKTLRPFLFCCFTELRFSDISKLCYKNIEGNNIYLRVTKTKTPLIIPITEPAIKFIENCNSPEMPIFKVPCNQTTNRCLKEIALANNIVKKLTYHSSRHTHATIGLSLGIPAITIQKVLGHADIKQTMIYARLIEVENNIFIECVMLR